MRIKLLITGILCLMSGGAAIAGHDALSEGQELLRAGLFDEAQRGFARLTIEQPDRPEGPFFEGFTLWWRLLDRPPGRETMQRQLEALFDESARRGAALAESSNPDVRRRGLTFSGVSLLLQAQSKAARGAHMAAADSVRHGHRNLKAAMALGPDDPDPLFAMGAYNYYADNLPLVVKGLRFFLNVPSGDEDAGLAQLELAARRSEMFSTEALLLLAHIRSSGEQSDGRQALGYLQEAVRRHPGSPLIRLAHADLLYLTGRFREASVRTGEALALLGARSGFAETIEPLARYRQAACKLMLGDAAAALADARSALERADSMRLSESRRWTLLFADAAAETGEAADAKEEMRGLALEPSVRHAGLERLESAARDPLIEQRGCLPASADCIPLLRSLAASHPSSGWVRFRLGRLLEEEGRRAEARTHLTRAVALGPVDVQGWALLRLGWIAEQEGDPRAARSHYERAGALRKFDFPLAARERVRYPGTGRPER